MAKFFLKTNEKKRDFPNSIRRAIFTGLAFLLQLTWIILLGIYLAKYYAVLNTLVSIITVLSVIMLLSGGLSSDYKISWIVIILGFPVFGLILALLFGRVGSHKTYRKRIANSQEIKEIHMSKCLVESEANLEKIKNEFGKAAYRQVYYIVKEAQYPAYMNTDVKYFGNTTEAMEAHLVDLERAENFIFMEYFAIEPKEAWSRHEEVLVRKIKEGVKVYFFYDDVGSVGYVDSKFTKHLRSLGIKCQVFNPIIPILNLFMNNRDHRKITVIDGKVAYTGGFNLADEYFNITSPYGRWKDSGIRLEGDAVRNLTAIFLEMWQNTEEKIEDITPFEFKYDYHATQNGFAIPYADTPLDGEHTSQTVYLNLIKSAQDYVYITTPYLILSEVFREELVLAAKRGVDVRILIPGIPDKKFIYQVSKSNCYELARAGIRIYEYTPGFVHAKNIVADDLVAAVGTVNFDFRSLYLNFENGCLFGGNEAVTDVRKDFEETVKESEEITDKYKRIKLGYRILISIMRFLSPLL